MPAKTIPRRKLMPTLRKISQIYNLTPNLKELGKKRIIESKGSSRRKITKIKEKLIKQRSKTNRKDQRK